MASNLQATSTKRGEVPFPVTTETLEERNDIKILLIDDQSLVHLFAQKFSERCGWNLTSAQTAQ